MPKDFETISAKTIISRVSKPSSWFGAEYNMNIYRGCSHGCIYCDSRSDCYRNADFDRIKVKENALQIIRDELRRKVKTGVIATGAMSDPYNPAERELKLSRHALELMNSFGFGAAITTKSALIARDIDVLQDIKSHSPVIAKITVTTADDGLCQKIEPNADATTRRFEAVAKLAQGGIYCGILLNPVLPFLTDTPENIAGVLRLAKEAGAKFVHTFMGMTLRAGNREYFYSRLDKDFPDVRGKYIKRFGNQYSCTAPDAKKLWGIFSAECERLGLLYDMKAITGKYKSGYYGRQLSLL
ncbi:MAG: radical SAM protein [Clostridiales bacterium]|jgi:DNA repair photolyase|nr:radical SAM protein [Clostridiales bacterium]